MGASLTREQRAMLEGFGRSAAEMLGKKTAPSLKVARGYIAEAGDHTYDVLMPDGAVLEEVPCLVSALGGTAGDEVRVEWVQGRALVTGVVATADNASYVKLLWSNASGWYMHASQTATLSEPVSEQRSGIVLHWQAYVNGSAQNYDHNYFFVPKSHVESNPGGGVSMFLTVSTLNAVTAKYVYVHDDRIVGNDVNNQEPSTTGSGIEKTPKYFVLTQVIGV